MINNGVLDCHTKNWNEISLNRFVNGFYMQNLQIESDRLNQFELFFNHFIRLKPTAHIIPNCLRLFLFPIISNGISKPNSIRKGKNNREWSHLTFDRVLRDRQNRFNAQRINRKKGNERNLFTHTIKLTFSCRKWHSSAFCPFTKYENRSWHIQMCKKGSLKPNDEPQM